MKTNQKKITAMNSTVIKMWKADTYASWERDQKEDGRPKAGRRENRIRRSMLQLREDGPQKQRLLHGIGAKANGRANEDTPRVSMDTKGGYNHHNSDYKGGCQFVNVCNSQSFAPQP